MRCIFIHGPAGVGKLTVASALRSTTGLPLFHNHLAVDAALALFKFGTPAFVKLREEMWLSAFREATSARQSFIFTFHPESSVRPGFINSARQTIESVGGRVVFIALTCAEAEIERRIVAEDRTQFRKLTSLNDYRLLRDSGAFEFPPLPEPALTLATDKLAPHEAASEIDRYLRSIAT
jgi:hypothetical protein